MWNALSEQAVSEKFVESFKGRLERFTRDHKFIYYYQANIKIVGTGSQVVPAADYVDLVHFASMRPNDVSKDWRIDDSEKICMLLFFF